MATIKKQFNLDLDDGVVKQLRLLSVEKNTSLKKFVESILTDHVTATSKEPTK